LNQRESPQPAWKVADTAYMRFEILALFLLVAGCGSTRSRAMTAFEEGRYPEAVAGFRESEPEAPDARYALYRGLAHLACGDVRAADRWLSFAKLLWEREPSLLSSAERGRLEAAWRSMGRMPGELPVRDRP
jgi:hypothetical protein